MFSVVICKVFQSQVSKTNVRNWGTLLQDALAERKAHFVRVLLEFGCVIIYLTLTDGNHFGPQSVSVADPNS